MVVAQEKIAARIGADVLRRGGNAVDAAVATGFAMAVTYPRAGNIGGGGFMVIHSAERHEDIAIDYRETAPAATTPEIFLGPDGKPDTDEVAQFRARHRRSRHRRGTGAGAGEIRLGQIHAGGIAEARDRRWRATALSSPTTCADTLPDWHRRLARWPSSAKIFSRADGTSLREGDMLVQTDLAATLVGDRRTGAARVLPRARSRKSW